MILLLLSTMFLLQTHPDAGGEQALRVMTFNVRYSTAPDGENRWENRRSLLFEVIRKFDPDVLGLQEALATQLEEIARELPTHRVIGVGRDDGKRKGEFSALLIRADRFDIMDSGTFWLSETPDVVASRSWDSALCRIATHATVVDRKSKRRIFLLNTHWDHQGAVARTESAKLIVARVEKALSQKQSVILTGDLNCTDTSEPYRIVAETLADAYRLTNPTRSSDEATFHNFLGTARGESIDFIFVSRDLSVSAAGIDRTQRDGRYPSDHFPVTAEIRIPIAGK